MTDAPTTPSPSPWSKFQNDFDAMSDAEIADESRRMSDQLDEAESWLEAVSMWEAAGRPRAKKEDKPCTNTKP